MLLELLLAGLASGLSLSGDSLSARNITVAAGEVVHVMSAGSGTPVVLVPGLFGGVFGYRKLVAPLEGQGYRVIIVEPLGTGTSAYPKGVDYSLTAQADRIASVLDTLGIRHALVVAHSVGVSMALRLTYRRPDLVRGLLAIDGGPVETAATPGLRHAMKFAVFLKLFMGQGTLRRKLRHGMIENSGDTSWVSDSVVRGYTAGPGEDLHRTIDALHGMAKSREPELLRNHLAQVRVPVRLLVGRVPHASAVTPDEVTQLKAEIRNFAVDSIAGSGQFIHEEQPDVVVTAVTKLDEEAVSH
ncbi:MAG TPA: alpha/beta hydrolase [Gemmatimonadales bacterium]